MPITFRPTLRARKTRISRGVISVWVALTVPLMVGVGGLALDTSYVVLTAHQLQNAADAAALAGAIQVQNSTSQATTDAITYAGKNWAAGASVQLATSDVVFGRYDQAKLTFTAGGTPYNAVQATARRTSTAPGGSINLFFGPIFGVNTCDVSRTATAMINGPFAAGVIALDPTRPSSFGANGNLQFTVANGGIQVDSNDPSAIRVVGNATIAATELRTVGGYTDPGNVTVPVIQTGVSPAPDPLANLPAPTYSTASDLGAINLTGNKSQTVNNSGSGPWYYSGGISMTSSNASLTLQPGIYVLGPPGLNISGGNLTANGVMFYFTGAPDKKGATTYGTVNLTGNGTVDISPPTSGTYQGLTFFQDRATPYSAVSASIVGTATMNLSGTVYLPTIGFSMGGTSTSFANQIIADQITASGNGTINVNYDGRNPLPLGNVFLVQ
ncbi:MAG TPA: pilus assembly protein TadG-related protein [Tepidisphaeraceae bacterium]|nr:pilus assembly protein TadG-related protein [Tepidisphaeraceae bacterium]